MTSPPPPSQQARGGPPYPGAPSGGPPPPTAASEPDVRRKPWWRKWRFIIPIALLALIVVAAVAGGGRSREEDAVGGEPAGTQIAAPRETEPATTPGATRQASAAPPPTQGPAEITFSDPLVVEESGFTSIGVLTTNESDEVRSFIAKATFKSGDNIVATATGFVNDMRPGERRAVSLLLDEDELPAYDSVRIDADTMVSEGASTDRSAVAELLAFGPLRVNNQGGFVTADVEITNGSDREVSVFVGAAFLRGGALIGWGSGAVNDLAPGQTKTASLLVTGSVDGLDETIVYPDTISIQ